MNRTPVTSRAVASIGYDPNTMTLEVEYSKGSVYQYFDVPETVYQDFVSAASMGAYLNQNIKGSYRESQI